MARLRKTHPLVAATQSAALERARVDGSGRLRLAPFPGLIPLAVSRPQLRRAMLVLNALFKLAETRGHQVVASDNDWGVLRGVAISVGGHKYPVRISELTSSIPMSESERARWRKDHPWRTDQDAPGRRSVPNGKLKLIFPSFIQGERTSWAEGPRGALESKFIKILDELEARARRDDLRDLERARQQRDRQRVLLERREHERAQQVHEQRSKRLSAEVAAWRRANEIRDYIAALRKRAVDLPEKERDRIEGWCDWAEHLASDTDPLVRIETITGLGDHQGKPTEDRYRRSR